MTTAYTSLLGLALPVTGELSGTWGDTVNNGITSLLDSAISGTTTLSADSDVTLTTTQGSSNTAREAILLWTAGGSATRTITAPAQSKIYTVINASSGTQSIILAGAGPTTGVTIAKGESALCAWNGSDFIKISNTAGPGTFTNLTVTGNTSLGDADTDTITQAASYVTGTQLKSAKTATNTLSLAAYDVDGTAYTNLITLTASNTPTLALTSTGVGTINNMSIGATTASTGAFTTLSASGAVTLSGGTINGVAYLNGTNVLTTGSALVFDGSNLGLGVTPSDWASNQWSVFESAYGGALAFYKASNVPVTVLTSNAYNDGSWKYKTTDPALQYEMDGNVGIHKWYNAPSWNGTGSPIINFTQAMTLDASGNLGVGTTSPTTKLHVFGSGANSRVENSGATNSTQFSVKNTVGTVTLGLDSSTGGGFGVANAAVLWYDAAQPLVFGTSNTERARIDSSGNLGLGVTPDASDWNASMRVFHAYQNTTNGAGVKLQSSNAKMIMSAGNAINYIGSIGATPIQFVMNSSAAMTLDASGNLGIGTTSPAAKLHIGVASAAVDGTKGVRITNPAGTIVMLECGSGGDSFVGTTSGSDFNIRTGNVTRATFDNSGNLLVGKTSSNNGTNGAQLSPTTQFFTNTNDYIALFNRKGTDGVSIYFQKDETNVGNISVTTSATAYNTSSDYRLKNTIAPMTGALAKVALLKPCTYKWNADGSDGQGFIAHELAEVVPQCVTGEKDAVDADGKPQYQGIDTSFLVATLTAAIQELNAKFEEYKAAHP